jgi:hypothetical protein
LKRIHLEAKPLEDEDFSDNLILSHDDEHDTTKIMMTLTIFAWLEGIDGTWISGFS